MPDHQQEQQCDRTQDESSSDHVPDRRPIAVRSNIAIQALARSLAAANITPNAISVSSIFFACVAGAALFATAEVNDALIPQRLLFATAFAAILLRLLANLLDGLVAVEFSRASPVGILYNEAPDRIADTVILVGFGYAAGGHSTLGWAAACAALLIAYLRALGVTAGARQHFLGPMAKPQRMFIVIIASAYLTFTPIALQTVPINETTQLSVPTLALGMILIGSFITVLRRWQAITSDLKGQSHAD